MARKMRWSEYSAIGIGSLYLGTVIDDNRAVYGEGSLTMYPLVYYWELIPLN